MEKKMFYRVRLKLRVMVKKKCIDSKPITQLMFFLLKKISFLLINKKLIFIKIAFTLPAVVKTKKFTRPALFGIPTRRYKIYYYYYYYFT